MDGGGDPYKVIITNAIYEITEVRFYDSTWTHITEGHPEFSEDSGGRVAIENTVANPTSIHRSETCDESYVFVSSNESIVGNSVVVPIKLVSSSSARIKTAYASNKIKGEVLWSQNDETE